MSWFKIIKKDNSSDYKIPEDVQDFIEELKEANREAENLNERLEEAEYHDEEEFAKNDWRVEEVLYEVENFEVEVFQLGEKLQSLIDKHKIKDMDDAVNELKHRSPIYYPTTSRDGSYVDYDMIIEGLEESFYVDPYDEEQNNKPKRGNKNKKIIEELDDFQTQHYEQYGTSEDNQDLEEFISAISNGDVSNLKRRFPFAHLVFEEAGLLGDLE